MEEQVTRTLLITNFPKTILHENLLQMCKSFGEVKEHFIMNNKHSVFFVSFYDLRASKRAYTALTNDKNKFVVRYAISLREIPKGSDSCSEEKNQGTVTYTANDEQDIENQAEIIERIKKGKEHTVRFYDSREALKFLSHLKSTQPRSSPKIAWDNDLRKRITLLKAAEEIVKNAPPGFFKGVAEAETSQKRPHASMSPGPEKKKRVKLSTNWMLALFDSFISENAERIALEL